MNLHLSIKRTCEARSQLELLISEDLGRPRRLLTSQFVTQSYQCRATNLVAGERRNKLKTESFAP